jgi:hypothetical protein
MTIARWNDLCIDATDPPLERRTPSGSTASEPALEDALTD